MQFSDTIDLMSTYYDAVKRPGMIGYVYRTTGETNGLSALPEEAVASGGMRLHFVQRNGDQYVYTFDGAARAFSYDGFVAHGEGAALGTGACAAGTALPLDADLLTHMGTGLDWSLGRRVDFETVRAPSGTGKW